MNINEMTLEEIFSLLSEVEDFDRYNKIHYLKPYPYQQKFMNASAKFKQRYARSGNRTGKTFGAAIEAAMHLTGLYQDYYKGERILNSGHIFWCIGITQDSTAKVMQKELLGTADIRVERDLGTGTIPLEHIETSLMVKEGYKAKIVRVKHIDGGYNELHFYASSDGVEKLMGQAIKFAWMDEEPKNNSMEIYSQCITRMATTQGLMLFTATPEQGGTELNNMFSENASGKLYLQSVSMYDAPHLTPEIIEELKAGWPEYQWDMRIKGLPVLGSGSVFPFLDSDVICEQLIPLPHWPILASIDWGDTTDPTVVSFLTHDSDNDIYYLFEQHVLDGEYGELNDRSAQSVARVIKASHWPNIPIIIPHDSGIKTNQRGVGAQLMNTGVNTNAGYVFENPPHLIINAGKVGSTTVTSRSIEVGLQETRRLVREGKFKVVRNCYNWFSEKNSYFYTGKTGDKAFSGADHCIDSQRYGLLSLVGGKGIPAGQCGTTFHDWNNGYDYEPTGFYSRDS